MKTKPTKTPKARVMWLYTDGKTGVATPSYTVSNFPAQFTKPAKPDIPGVFTPCSSRREAEQRKKWANLSYEQKADAIATALMNHDSSPPRYWATCRKFSAPAILSLVGESHPTP